MGEDVLTNGRPADGIYFLTTNGEEPRSYNSYEQWTENWNVWNKKDSANNMFCWLLLLSNPRLSNPRFICPEVHCVLTLWNLAVSSQIFFTRPLLPEGSSLQVEILSVCLFVCPSSLQYFQYMAFKSSQNHVRPHILYIIGKRMTSATTMTMTKTHTKTNTKTKTKTFKKKVFPNI